MAKLMRRTLVSLAICVVLAACSASSGGSTSSSAPVASDSTLGSTTPSSDSTPPHGENSTPPTTSAATPPNLSHDMAVDGALHVGVEFAISFSGSLRKFRGGYLWLQQPDGTRVALLRGDGNTEIPMGYELDVANAEMLADGLSGDTSTFVLPPRLAPGPYILCTANSARDACIEVDVLAP